MGVDDFKKRKDFQKEVQINKYLKLRLEENKTIIYVNGERFIQCKFLKLNIPKNQIEDFDEVKSIDEAKFREEKLSFFNKNLIPPFDEIGNKIPPEEELWGHSSNLQAWAGNNYGTRLLSMNLAFPLLRRLVEAGDPIARRVFKEEIAERFGSGYLNTIIYLIENGYLDYFTREELGTFLDEVHPASETLLQGSTSDNPYFRELILKFFKKMGDFGGDFIITHIKEFIKKLDSYELVNLVLSIMDKMERKSMSPFFKNNAKPITERIK